LVSEHARDVLAAHGGGDFDLMLPLFNMYLGQVPGNSVIVSNYYHHQGAYFMETAPFWGGLTYAGPECRRIDAPLLRARSSK